MNTANARATDMPRFENRGPLWIAGLSVLCTDTAARDIPALWQQFGGHIGKIHGQVGSTTYGVCRENGDSIEYLCGVEVRQTSGLPAGFSVWSLPAHRYAVFPHPGHVSTLRDTIHTVFTERLPKAGLIPAKAPFFERYGAQFNPGTGLGDMEIWVPVQSA